MIESGSSRLLELLRCPVEDRVPEGWKTVEQMAKELGMSYSHTGKLLRSAMKEGKVERRMFRITIGSFARPVAHYKVK